MKVNVPAILEGLGIRVDERRGRAGVAEFWAPCPLPGHPGEKEPSWHCTSAGGAWYCFGCKNGGGPTDLVMAVKGWPLKEALKWLAEGAKPTAPKGFRVKIMDPWRKPRRDFVIPNGVIFEPSLERWPSTWREEAEKRGITAEQVARWSIGFGLNGKLHDRLVFPIHDDHGRLCSYTARTVIGHRIRYLTPDVEEEHPITGYLFGMVGWPSLDHRKACTVILTEGAINGLACSRARPDCFIGALGGSYLDPLMVARISTFGHVIRAMDNDKAGNLAADGLSVLVRRTTVSRAEFPAGMDAADLLKHDPEGLERCLTVTPV